MVIREYYGQLTICQQAGQPRRNRQIFRIVHFQGMNLEEI